MKSFSDYDLTSEKDMSTYDVNKYLLDGEMKDDTENCHLHEESSQSNLEECIPIHSGVALQNSDISPSERLDINSSNERVAHSSRLSKLRKFTLSLISKDARESCEGRSGRQILRKHFRNHKKNTMNTQTTSTWIESFDENADENRISKDFQRSSSSNKSMDSSTDISTQTDALRDLSQMLMQHECSEELENLDSLSEISPVASTTNINRSFGEKVAQYLQRGGSRLHEQQRRLKSQIWSSVVTIILVEAKHLPATSQSGSANPYVKFRLGNEKYKSKVELKTQNPRWLEQFDFHLFEDQSHLLEITVCEKDPRWKDDFVGKCTIDLRQFERENTHKIWVDLEDEDEAVVSHVGKLYMLVTLSGTTSSASISDLMSYKENPHEIQAIKKRYHWLRTFHNIRDVGLLTVKVFKAQGLAAADFGVGKSDPFCVLELVNARLQTQTEYKTLAPSWNKIFTFDVKDIHSVLEITVYDEDRDHKVDFLGKVVVPLLKIENNEKKWYALKDKKLRMRAKGNHPEILIECSIYWNPIRAALQTVEPKEEKYMQMDTKFKRYVFVKNVNRVKTAVMDLVDIGLYIKSCFEWESTSRSITAFAVFMLATYYFEAYMAPAGLLLIFLKNYIVMSIVGSKFTRDEESDLNLGDEYMDEEEKEKEEKKTLKERLVAIQEVIASVQNTIGEIASYSESIMNTFNFTVPFLSWLMVIFLVVGTAVLYYVPIRVLIMIWGINKFTRKLIRPNSVVTNEVIDFLSRVPDDEELRDYRDLRPLVHQSSEDRKKEMKKRKTN